MSSEFSYTQRSIGEQVRLWRKHRGWKQGTLEERADLAHNTVSRIENDAVSPKLDTVNKIAQALDISVEELQFRTPPVGVVREPSVDYLVERIEHLPDYKRTECIDTFLKLLDMMERTE